MAVVSEALDTKRNALIDRTKGQSRGQLQDEPVGIKERTYRPRRYLHMEAVFVRDASVDH
jgi:hypothetical protein